MDQSESEIALIPDPFERIRAAARAIEANNQANSRLARIRVDAAVELRASGVPIKIIAERLGIGYARARRLTQPERWKTILVDKEDT